MLVTLEDPPGEGKGPIPAGVYRVTLSYSRRLKQLLPEILEVPGFTGIRMHAGNTSADTKGCPLVGMYQASDHEIGSSVEALGHLLSSWRFWCDQEIEILDPPGAVA